jgi:hypothetical protein
LGEDRSSRSSHICALEAEAKGLNQADKVLAKSIGNRLIHALRMLKRQRRVITTGRVKAALIWELPPDKPLL